MLADGLGLKAEPSLYLVLCPDQLCPDQLPGTNFAVAGARSVKLPDGFPIDLPVQVDVFLASRGFSAPSDALYVVFIGGNDVRDARDTAGEEMAQEIISNAVDEIDSTIRTLAWAGAKNFVLANVPDIGSLPESGPVGGMTAKRASKLTRMFNGSLAQAVEYIEDDFDIEILEFNTFRFLRSVIANAERVGFQNTEDACFPLLPLGRCDFNSFVFFDEIHPTAAVHALAGEALLELVRDEDDEDDKD